MKTIRDIVSRIRISIKEMGADSYYPNRYLWNVFRTASLKLMERNKKWYKSDIFSTIHVESEEVNLLEDSCVPLNCMGTRIKIPNVSEGKQGFIYKYIASPDLSQFYKLVSPKLFMLKTKKSMGNQRYTYRDGDYLYFKDSLPCYRLSVLGEDGKEGVNGGCSKLDNEINVPEYLIDDSVRVALEEISASLGKPVDRVPNKSEI